MPDTTSTREEDLRQLLTDAIEVQLAALKAGIGFWSDWVTQTSEFVQSATNSLLRINSEDEKSRDLLLELVDAGRASIRTMTDIPRNTAVRFIEELDKIDKKKTEPVTPSGTSRPPARSAVAKSVSASRAVAKKSVRRKRAGRVKE